MGKKGKYIIVIVLALIVAAIPIIIFASRSGSENAQQPEMLNEKIVLNGLELQNLCSYSGKFVEDGSDEEVSNVLAARIKNCTGQDLEYAEIELVYGGVMYNFSVSALPAGKTVQALELGRAAFPEKSDDVTANLLNAVYFAEPMSLCGDAITVEGSGNRITVTNISGADISGRITICYKNVCDGEYLGGIAYRVGPADGLAAGGSATAETNHFNSETCEIVFVNYGE